MNDMHAVKFHQSQLFLVYPVDKFRLCSSGRGGGGGGGGGGGASYLYSCNSTFMCSLYLSHH